MFNLQYVNNIYKHARYYNYGRFDPDADPLQRNKIAVGVYN